MDNYRNSKRTFSVLIVYFLTVIAFLVSCNRDKSQVSDKDILDLNFLNNIDEYYSGVFVNDVSDIKYYDADYFIADINIGSLFIFNRDFKFKNKIGQKGRGPKEFITMTSVTVTPKNIFISDYVGNYINRYDRETFEFCEQIIMPKGYRVPMRDFYADDTYNFSVIGRGERWNNVALYNSKKNEIEHFKNFNISNIKEQMSFVKPDNDNIYGIPRYSKEIYIFSLNDKMLIKKLEIPFPKSIIKSWEKLKEKGKNPPLFTDAYIDKGLLYIGFQNFDSDCRGLAQIVMDESFKINSINYFYFRKRNGDDIICVANDKIVSYAIAPRAIQQYELPTHQE